MKYQIISYENVKAQISEFRPQSGKNIEYHVIFNLTNPQLSFEQQCRSLINAINFFVQEQQFNKAFAVFGRCFMNLYDREGIVLCFYSKSSIA